MKTFVPDYIMSLKPYKPGKPIEELEREYGIKNSIKLASNENPLGPPASALKAITDTSSNIHRYPDGGGFLLTQKIADKSGLKSENVVLGNGSDDIISLLTRAFLAPGDEALMTQPSFLMYEIMVKSDGGKAICVPLLGASEGFGVDLQGMADRITPKTRMVFLTNPNNPTGNVLSKSGFKSFFDRVPEGVIIVIDEAYIEFADDDCLRGQDYLFKGKPVVVLRTFSKAYGLAGMRVGYGLMHEDISAILHRVRQPFNVNILAQSAAVAALDDDDYLEESKKVVRDGLSYLYSALSDLGVPYYSTQTNFFLIDVGRSADEVFESLLKEGVIVRSMTSYGYPGYIRVSVGLPEENVRFVEAFKKVMKL